MEMSLPGHRPITQGAMLNFGTTGTADLTIDATNLDFAGPLDLAGLVATAHWAVSENMPVTLKLPKKPDVASYLQRMDVLRHMPSRTQILGPRPSDSRNDHSGRLLEVTPLDARNGPDLSERLGPLITGFYKVQEAEGGGAVFRACGELLSNAVEHGLSSTGAFIAAQTYSGSTTEGPRLEFAVCDTGDGVLTRLRANSDYGHLDRDDQAILTALNQGVSGLTDEGRGNGLCDVIEDTRPHGTVHFQMRSGRGQVVVTGNRNHTSRTPDGRDDHTSGTWASLTHWPGPAG